MEFTGEFETHLTVCPDGSERIDTLRQWGLDQGLKCVHIVLDRGETASQPMLTRRGKGTLSSELITSAQLRQALRREGFMVTRVKIEVPPWSQDVPQSRLDAPQHPSDRYFEHHLKLLLDPDADTAPLSALAEQYAARLSRNALKQREDGYQERFITQRCWSVGRVEARLRLDALVSALMPLGYPLLDIEEEFVVYDSNLAVDAGWL